MGVVKKIIAILLLLVVALVGFLGYIYAKTGGEPVTVNDLELVVDTGQVTRDKIPIEVHVYYENNAGISATIKEGNMTVYVNGIPLARVTLPEEEVAAGNGTLIINTVIDNSLLGEAAAKHLANGEKSTIKVEGSVRIGLPVIRLPVTIPVNLETSLETSLLPYTDTTQRTLVDAGPLGSVRVTNITIDFQKLEGDTLIFPIYVTVENNLKSPLVIPEIGYQASMNGTVLAQGETQTRLELKPGETGTLQATLNLTQDSIEEFLYMHILNKESSTINLDVWLKIEVPELNVDIGKVYHITENIQVKTNIFEYK